MLSDARKPKKDRKQQQITAVVIKVSLFLTWKRGNCKCIATWGRPSHATTPALFRFNYDAIKRLLGFGKFEVTCYIVAFFAADYFMP